MEWSFRGDLPIYAQLVAQIQRAIVAGIYAPGEKLSSVRDMASEAGVNPNTLQRALQELERQGLVYSQRTAGRYVTEDTGRIEDCRLTLAREQLRDFLGSMESLGYTRADIAALLNKEEEECQS